MDADDRTLDTPAKIADYVCERFEREAPGPPDGIVVTPVLRAIRVMAFSVLILPPEIVRKVDAREFPPSWMRISAETFRHGCHQIVQWRGLSPDRALEGLGIQGFNDLLLFFGFRLSEQSARCVEGQPDVFLDEMCMIHDGDGATITLYNLVDHRKPAPADCPYCGKPLRTATAKQCRSCGMDWHDPANVICRKQATDV